MYTCKRILVPLEVTTASLQWPLKHPEPVQKQTTAKFKAIPWLQEPLLSTKGDLQAAQ